MATALQSPTVRRTEVPSGSVWPAEALFDRSNPSEAGKSNDTSGELFTARELEEFREDDASAGRTIGTILCVMFAWLLFVSIAVVWWSFATIL